jgi:flagella basal body P-ring formation protein FlgA
MLLKIFFLFTVFFELLFSNSLNSDYYVNSNDINLSVIVPDVKKDIILFSILQGKYTKRVKSKDLIKQLKFIGYDSYTSESNYIKFTKKSPIDISKIKKHIEEFYNNAYKNIEIKQISIVPRSYIKSLPDEYIIDIQKRNSLRNYGILYIKTKEQKKIFFDYTISAKVNVYIAKQRIKRDVKLSTINCTKKSIILDKFRDIPLQTLPEEAIQSKKQIRRGDIITLRDIRKLSLVKRGSYVNVTLNSANMIISFSAIAQQDAKLDDIITVQKNDGQKLKVRVIGKNTAEMR